MPHLIIRSTIILATFLAIAALSIVLLFNTQIGRNFIGTQAENYLGSSLNNQVTIGTIKGGLPGRIEVSDVALADENGRWLQLDDAQLVWSPMSLLNGSIKIETIDVSRLSLIRPPQTEQPAQDKQDRRNFQLPAQLPSVSIKEMAFRNIEITDPASGEIIALAGNGHLIMGGRQITGELHVASTTNTDVIDAVIDFDPAKAVAAVDIDVQSAKDGVMSRFGHLNGPLKFSATGSGTPTELPVAIVGEIGAFGSIDSRMKIAAADQLTIDFNGGLQLGEKLQALRKQIGENISFATVLIPSPAAATLTIHEIEADAFRLQGGLALTSRNNNISSLESDLELELNQGFFSAVNDHIGEKIRATAQVNRVRTGFATEANITGDKAKLVLENGQTDLLQKLTGDFSLVIHESQIDALADIGELIASMQADIDLSDTARFDAVTLSAGSSTLFSGRGMFQFSDENLNASGALNLPPNIASNILPALQASDAINADVEVDGSIRDFTTKLTARFSDLMINQSAVSPIRVEADFSGLPSHPTGDIVGKPETGPGQFNMRVNSAVDGVLSVPYLLYEQEGFKLSGQGSYHRTSDMLDIDLTYTGTETAEPLPGISLMGDFHAKGVINPQSGNTSLTVNSNALSSTAFDLSNLKISAAGPANALAITLEADQFRAQSATPILNISTMAVADLQNAFAAVTGLAFSYGDTPVKLTQTATFTIDEALKVENLEATIGQVGLFSLDGSFSDRQLTGSVSAERIPTPNPGTVASFQTTFNTDDQSIAQGQFSLLSDISQENGSALKGDFRWQDGQFNVETDDANIPIYLNLTVPAQLVREPALGVLFEGPLAGNVKYQGSVSRLTAFLPLALQTLEGTLDFNTAISGTLKEPKLDGDVSFADGAYTEINSGLSLINMTANAEMVVANGQSSIVFTGGASGTGQSEQSISMNGNVALGETATLEAVVELSDARFSAEPVSNVAANGKIEISGPLTALNTVGTILIDELNAEIITPEATGLVDINVVAADGSPENLITKNAASTSAAPNMNIKVEADDRLFIRGRGLESEWKANVSIVTDNAASLVLGRIDLRRGWLDFSGRRFELTEGEIIFNKISPNDPFLKLRAEYETEDETIAAIVVGGRSSTPEVTLESTPSLPREDIMALVLFGKPANELSVTESLQMAQALAQLGGIGPFGGGGLTGSARDSLGLDLLNLDLDPESGGSSLTVGKYVADGLFVSATQDVKGENGSVRIEYEVRDNITLETELKQNGDQTVSANWKRDF